MKKVFVYSNFDFSVKNAGVTRMLYYAQALANKNTSVYLVSCSSSTINKKSFKEVLPNVFILNNNNLTYSFLGTFKFVKKLYKFSKKTQTENAFIFYPSPLVYLEITSLFYLKLIKREAVFYELNEVRKHTSAFHKKSSFKRLKYSIKKIIFKTSFSFLELFLCFYDGLICISSAIEEYGKKFNKNTIRIPILTNPDLKKEFSNIIYSKGNSFNIGFSGKIHPDKENLLNFFKVLSKLKNKGIVFTLNLCGPIEEKHKNLLLDKAAKSLNIKENINYYGNLNTKELSTFLSQQQLLVIPRGYTKQNHFGFSTKLSDYLNHGKPILITDVSDNKLFIKDSYNGFIVPADDNEKMLTKIEQIVKNYNDIYEVIERNAMETSKKSFYYRNFESRMSIFLFKN
ncbi:glycosyltransferase [Algibacter sp. R77976]|uniref:glycosyltransferase n=1 Tax=Algibacter sp. R77976 TaxID=3093873 RepID=UPI0037C9C4B4